VALFVITLLVGSLLVPLTTQVEQRQIGETQKTLEDIKEALIGYALNKGFLPCPDTDNDGIVNPQNESGNCTSSEGNLPWATLGIGQSDVWGNRLHYRVDPNFAQNTPIKLDSPADLQVCTSATCATRLTSSTAGNGAAVVILSHGKNGRGAINSQTGVANPAPSSADELENTNGNTTFVSRTPSTADAAVGEFDDIVSWLSKYLVFNRMVSAGKLP